MVGATALEAEVASGHVAFLMRAGFHGGAHGDGDGLGCQHCDQQSVQQ
jgi:hypothetical protein